MKISVYLDGSKIKSHSNQQQCDIANEINYDRPKAIIGRRLGTATINCFLVLCLIHFGHVNEWFVCDSTTHK